MTNAQLELHRVQGHAKYHPGCKHCVKARALADKHQRSAGSTEDDDPLEPPVVSADFCFPGDEDSENPMTVIVMNDSRTKSMFFHSCPGKETVTGKHSEYIVTKVTDNINFLGRCIQDRQGASTDGIAGQGAEDAGEVDSANQCTQRRVTVEWSH